MGVDHLGEAGLRQEIQRLWRELRRVAKATIQNASIGRAGIRVYDGGWIRIEGGGLSVTGTATVSGDLNVSGTETVSGRLEGSGTFDWDGPMFLKGAQSITGPTTFTGQMTVNGSWDLNGNGDITGDVGLSGDLNVTGGGRITAGDVTITPSSNGGAVQFGGSEVRGTDGGISLDPGSGASITTSAAGVRIAYLPGIPRANANNAVVGTIWISSLGYLYQVID